jgi:macrolide-specific efflux system membrane fusion protein
VIDDGGRISLRRVKVGLNNKVDAQILSGLSAGERVIVSEVSAGQSNAAGGMPPPWGCDHGRLVATAGHPPPLQRG